MRIYATFLWFTINILPRAIVHIKFTLRMCALEYTLQKISGFSSNLLCYKMKECSVDLFHKIVRVDCLEPLCQHLNLVVSMVMATQSGGSDQTVVSDCSIRVWM